MCRDYKYWKKRLEENALNILIITNSLPEIWLEKFGTMNKPHYLKKCILCGNTYGEHYAQNCACPKQANP